MFSHIYAFYAMPYEEKAEQYVKYAHDSDS